MRLRIVALAAVVVLVGTPLGAGNRALAQTMTPAAVAAAFERTYNARDLSAFLALLSDDITIRTVPALPGLPSTISGKAEVQDLIRRDFALHGRDVVRSGFTTTGNHVTWVVDGYSDLYHQLGIEPVETTADATVEQGQIVALTYTVSPAALQAIQRLAAKQQRSSTAQLPAQLPAAMPRTGGGGAAG